MLRNLGVTTAAAVAIMLGIAGVAYAGDHDGDHDDNDHDSHGSSQFDCSSHEETEQYNSGDQVIGGNANVQDITGPASGQVDKVAICPSFGNNNEIG